MEAVAVFTDDSVHGQVIFRDTPTGSVIIQAQFTALPPGEHGFHIHKNGDLREPGCAGACEHFHKGPSGMTHGGYTSKIRHTGDLGNISRTNHLYRYRLADLRVAELLGRTLIVHADPDDLGQGDWPDSKITGHSGACQWDWPACAVIGRSKDCAAAPSGKRKTRKQAHK